MIDELPTAEVDGQRVACRQSGRGPALVLLHGFLCASRVWRHQLAGLAGEFTAVAWDAPGAGASSDPPEPFTTANDAECLAAFLDSIGIERPHHHLAAAIPKAELAIIRHVGHLSNMEQPEAFNAHLRRFCLTGLAHVWAAGSARGSHMT